MANEVTAVDENGQAFGLEMLRDVEALKVLDVKTLEELVYLKKNLDGGFKKVDAELKARLDAGVEFNHISYGESSKQMLAADDESLKKAFVRKYGWEAVQVKTPTQLKKRFGTDIQEDLDKVVVYETQKRVKYE